MSDLTYTYLRKKGAVRLLCEIDPQGSRYTDLDEALDISHSTVGERLGELKEVSLIQHEATTGGRGTTNLYKLTPKGATFRRALHESGTVMAHRQLKAARNQFELKNEEMQEWARTELPKFSDERHEANLSLVQDDSDFYVADDDLRNDDPSDEE